MRRVELMRRLFCACVPSSGVPRTTYPDDESTGLVIRPREREIEFPLSLRGVVKFGAASVRGQRIYMLTPDDDQDDPS